MEIDSLIPPVRPFFSATTVHYDMDETTRISWFLSSLIWRRHVPYLRIMATLICRRRLPFDSAATMEIDPSIPPVRPFFSATTVPYNTDSTTHTWLADVPYLKAPFPIFAASSSAVSTSSGSSRHGSGAGSGAAAAAAAAFHGISLLDGCVCSCRPWVASIPFFSC